MFIWDFDGIIVFTPHELAWKIASEAYGIRGFTSEFYRKYVSGRPRIEGGKIILEKLGYFNGKKLSDKEREEEIKKFTNFKNRVFRELVEKGFFKVNWAAISFIIKAKEHDIFQVLASASRNVRIIADRVVVKGYGKLTELFDADVSGSGRTKDEVFRRAVDVVRRKRMKIQCIVVFEDSPSGIIAAKKLGFKTVGYRDQALRKYGADYVIYDFSKTTPLHILKELGCYFEANI
ncbi:MAG: HAD family phosphatase [Thermoprotei archaeon]|nr:MAG: HAD family phosphatase [Thermoprotei archaeon]